MRLEIRSVDHPLNQELVEHMERRLRFALGRFDSDIAAVAVRVRNTNHAHHGNTDKLCRIQLHLTFGPALVAEADGPDLLYATDLAADRIARVVANTLKRRHYARAARAPA